MDLKSEIFRRVEALSPEQQYQVLAYCDTFEHTQPDGEPSTALLPFAGVLDDASAKEMLNQATKDWHSEADSAISASATFPNLELLPLCRPLLWSPSPLASKR